MSTTVKGIIWRDPVQTNVACNCPTGHSVAVTAVHIHVQEQDQNGDVVADHDCVGVAWDFPALGITMSGDEVEVTYDSDHHITAFRITTHI